MINFIGVTTNGITFKYDLEVKYGDTLSLIYPTCTYI